MTHSYHPYLNKFANVAIIVAIEAADVPIDSFSATDMVLTFFCGTNISQPGLGLAPSLTLPIMPFM